MAEYGRFLTRSAFCFEPEDQTALASVFPDGLTSTTPFRGPGLLHPLSFLAHCASGNGDFPKSSSVA
jgi:hypothetical protein